LPRLVIGPPTDAQLDALLAAPDRWPEGRAAVAALLHPDHNWHEVADDVLRPRFAAMRALGLALELEVGAVKPWSQEGRRTFEIEAPWWRWFLALGAPLRSIAIDEPWGSGRALDIADTDVAEETAAFIALVHRDFPDLPIGDIEPYPALPMADHLQWLHSLNAALERRVERRIDFYRLDANWNAFQALGGSWAEVVDLSRECRAAAVAFSLIYWAASLPQQQRDGTATPDSWSRAVVDQAAAYRASGGDADQVVVQSRVGKPDAALPETDPASFAGSVLGVLRALR
jgi:hypothetical protein